MFSAYIKTISDKSHGLLPTPKSVVYSIISILVIIGSIILAYQTVKASKPKEVDTSELRFMKQVFEQEYYYNLNKKNNN